MSACGGWLGVAKVSCSLSHLGIQLNLAYRWVRPAIFVAGNGIGGMFLFLLFLPFHSCSFLPCPSFSSPLLSLLSLFSLSLGDDTKWPTRGVVKPQHNQSESLACDLGLHFAQACLSKYFRYGKYPKISYTKACYTMAYENSADPNQTAPEDRVLHCLPLD